MKKEIAEFGNNDLGVSVVKSHIAAASVEVDTDRLKSAACLHAAPLVRENERAIVGRLSKLVDDGMAKMMGENDQADAAQDTTDTRWFESIAQSEIKRCLSLYAGTHRKVFLFIVKAALSLLCFTSELAGLYLALLEVYRSPADGTLYSWAVVCAVMLLGGVLVGFAYGAHQLWAWLSLSNWATSFARASVILLVLIVLFSAPNVLLSSQQGGGGAELLMLQGSEPSSPWLFRTAVAALVFFVGAALSYGIEVLFFDCLNRFAARKKAKELRAILLELAYVKDLLANHQRQSDDLVHKHFATLIDAASAEFACRSREVLSFLRKGVRHQVYPDHPDWVSTIFIDCLPVRLDYSLVPIGAFQEELQAYADTMALASQQISLVK